MRRSLEKSEICTIQQSLAHNSAELWFAWKHARFVYKSPIPFGSHCDHEPFAERLPTMPLFPSEGERAGVRGQSWASGSWTDAPSIGLDSRAASASASRG